MQSHYFGLNDKEEFTNALKIILVEFKNTTLYLFLFWFSSLQKYLLSNVLRCYHHLDTIKYYLMIQAFHTKKITTFILMFKTANKKLHLPCIFQRSKTRCSDWKPPHGGGKSSLIKPQDSQGSQKPTDAGLRHSQRVNQEGICLVSLRFFSPNPKQ